MGVETTLLIGERNKTMYGDRHPDHNYFKVQGSVEIPSHIFHNPMANQRDAPKVFFYPIEGSTEIATDRYDSDLHALCPLKLLAELENSYERERDPRTHAAIALLRSFLNWQNSTLLSCILYFH